MQGTRYKYPVTPKTADRGHIPRWSSSFSLRIHREDKLKLELQQSPPHSNLTVMRKFKSYKTLVKCEWRRRPLLSLAVPAVP